ncbi:NfeD family protein [Pseudomarimonas arenosa]|nr:nodulation protein NfeD [Pseudomarimonas arenosa]
MLIMLAVLAAGISLAFAQQQPAEPEPGQTAGERPLVIEVAIVGPIGPATTDFFRRALLQAEQRGAAALILRLDTPGGLAEATRDIDQAILSAKLPVIAWVAPSGSRAASAGTYILYASHLAAMARGTHLGAATPVAIGGPSSPTPPRPLSGANPGDSDQEDKPSQDADPQPQTAMERKVVNDSAAYLRALAELRGRNVDWAERAVRSAESLTADEALQNNVIEVLADNRSQLLNQVHGREVKLSDQKVVLDTRNALVELIEPDWRTELLSLITNPSVAYVLLLAGLYGLLLEGYNPGATVPGVVGVVCLLLAAYALQVLPVNFAGLALIIVGIGLMLAELTTPSFGVFGIGGVVALVFGSVVLFDSDVPGFAVSRGLIGGIAAISGGGVLLLLYVLARARGQPVSSGLDELLRLPAIALDDFQRQGWVQARGESWRALSEQPVKRGQRLQVVAVDGLKLRVKPSDATEASAAGETDGGSD